MYESQVGKGGVPPLKIDFIQARGTCPTDVRYALLEALAKVHLRGSQSVPRRGSGWVRSFSLCILRGLGVSMVE